MLRLVPPLTLFLFLCPVLVGLAGTIAPAFGYLPAIGAVELSLDPFRTLFAWPGFASALKLTLGVGALASLLSLLGAVSLVAMLSGTRWFARIQTALTPLLASPHASVALGLAFVLAPSGWIVRVISPELTGWTRPPGDLVTIRDPHGLALVAGLLVKEIPYLAITLTAALGQVPALRLVACARAMGYAPTTAWLKLVLPQLWPQIRLPFYAVIAYSLSVVDQALVLGPGTPPPLAVLATRWFSDYDLAQYLPAAATGVLQLGIVIAGLVLSLLVEHLIARAGRRWITRGGRSGLADFVLPMLAGLATLILSLGLLALLGLALWSIAGSWPFASSLPRVWSFDAWMGMSGRLATGLATTLTIACAATLVALALCLGCLEHESRKARRPGNGVLWLLYLPLLVPQIAFLFGLQVALVRLRLDGTLLAVVWAHLVFVLPYVFLSLADPWRALDPRLARSATSLGASPGRVLLAIKLPMLLRPILIAAAVGIAVSIGQYLATIFAGAGRISTITTDALTLSSGADRATIGVLGFMQSVVPLACYGIALTLPRLVFRNRRGLL
ncbi:ABC transporter permease [Bosea sp. PAMC 26642]|uniref:ABC transporter permease n=1 Tax=Bosea sp. (strain PAMC 26642) TaxID=1792307 RepID=UPI000770507D|nr:ABC transporter permease subunit [Bosea sp. PAMC 26642]AMJ63210.1 ABC transporter permease [Bosea sp. PAMC 26642]